MKFVRNHHENYKSEIHHKEKKLNSTKKSFKKFHENMFYV